MLDYEKATLDYEGAKRRCGEVYGGERGHGLSRSGLPIDRSMIEFSGADQFRCRCRKRRLRLLGRGGPEADDAQTRSSSSILRQPDRRHAEEEIDKLVAGLARLPKRRSCRTRSTASSLMTASRIRRCSPIRKSAIGSSCSTAGQRRTR